MDIKRWSLYLLLTISLVVILAMVAQPAIQQIVGIAGQVTRVKYEPIKGDSTWGLDVDITRPPALSSTLTTGQVAVDSTADQIVAANTNRREMVLQNIGGNDAYCGKDSTVSTTTGFWLPVNATFIDDKYNGAYWCITASGVSTTVAYREVS